MTLHIAKSSDTLVFAKIDGQNRVHGKPRLFVQVWRGVGIVRSNFQLTKREYGDAEALAMDSLFACSGPGAGAAIAESVRIGYDHAMLVGGLFMNSLALAALTRQWIVPAIVLGLLAVHPAWTVSAISGDCGEFKRFASFAVTWTGVAVLISQAIRGFWMRRKVAN